MSDDFAGLPWHHQPSGGDYLAYVREYYGVDVQIGQRVRVDGDLGTVIYNPDFANHYVHVRLDRGMDAPCHPTWRMVYLPELR